MNERSRMRNALAKLISLVACSKGCSVRHKWFISVHCSEFRITSSESKLCFNVRWLFYLFQWDHSPSLRIYRQYEKGRGKGGGKENYKWYSKLFKQKLQLIHQLLEGSSGFSYSYRNEPVSTCLAKYNRAKWWGDPPPHTLFPLMDCIFILSPAF